ncbi:MAG: aldehyde dehydrogenase family protein, partial [Desulfobacterales bacterium]
MGSSLGNAHACRQLKCVWDIIFRYSCHIQSFFDSGQVCVVASRFYIHNRLYDAFTEKFVTALRELR